MANERTLKLRVIEHPSRPYARVRLPIVPRARHDPVRPRGSSTHLPKKAKTKNTAERIAETWHARGVHSFLRLSGKTIDITNYRRIERGSSQYTPHYDIHKLVEAAKDNTGKRYMLIHTHSSEPPTLSRLDRLVLHLYGVGEKGIDQLRNFTALPSGSELIRFIGRDDDLRSLAVAVRNPYTGEVLGYHVIRKTGDTPKWGISSGTLSETPWICTGRVLKSYLGIGYQNRRLSKAVKKYESMILDCLRDGNAKAGSEALEAFMGKYNLAHRYLAAKGYELHASGGRFEEKAPAVLNSTRATT